MWHGQMGGPKRLSCWRVSQQPAIDVHTRSDVWEWTTPSSHSVTGDNQVRLCTAQLPNWFSYKSMAGKLVHTVYHRINSQMSEAQCQKLFECFNDIVKSFEDFNMTDVIFRDFSDARRVKTLIWLKPISRQDILERIPTKGKLSANTVER